MLCAPSASASKPLQRLNALQITMVGLEPAMTLALRDEYQRTQPSAAPEVKVAVFAGGYMRN